MSATFDLIAELSAVRRGLPAALGVAQHAHARRLRRAAQQLRAGREGRQRHGRPVQ